MSNALPGSLTAEEIESWARDASRKDVRVTYRVTGQQATTTRAMGWAAYMRWTSEARNNGYELVRAEQVARES